MLWPKKNSYKELDNEKKNSCGSKNYPPTPPPPHNFSNGPSLKKGPVHAYQMKTVTEDAFFQKRSLEWRVLKTPASRLRLDGRKRS